MLKIIEVKVVFIHSIDSQYYTPPPIHNVTRRPAIDLRAEQLDIMATIVFLIHSILHVVYSRLEPVMASCWCHDIMLVPSLP